MDTSLAIGALVVGGGTALLIGGALARGRARDAELADVLRLPYGEGDVDLNRVAVENGPVTATALDLATTALDRFDPGNSLRRRVERADLSMRPSEVVVAAGALGLAVGLALALLAGRWWVAPIVLLLVPLATTTVLDILAERRVRRFAAQLPDALSMISASLAAGHTFLRSIQMMADEFDQPLAGEFRRVVTETELGSSLVDSLDRLAVRVPLRDLEWMVQAIRIQQQVGGHLSGLLATLADFMRARDEVRREIRVLTAEGRMSAWVLGAMPLALFVAVQAINPGYMDPMLKGWGIVWLAVTAASMAAGIAIILRMVKKVEL